MRILICDDHAIFRAGLRTVMADLDAELAEAATAAEAHACLDSIEVDLLLLDLNLPDVDGWATLRKLRSERPEMPVIIVSSSDSPEDVRAALDAGASGFIPKSSPAPVLKAALQVVLSGGLYVPPEALGASHAPPYPAESTDTAPRPSSRKVRDAQLTPRQLEVMQLVARGLTNKDIARILEVGESTVKSHVASSLTALNVSNRTEATLVLRELGLD